MIIEIKGVEIDNKGSHSMLRAILDNLYQFGSEIEVAVRVTEKFPADELKRIPAYRKISLRKNIFDFNMLCYHLPEGVRRYLKGVLGWVTEADIDLILDASGFSYSDQWPSKIRIYHLHNELLRFKKYHKPYVFLPQAFGPFKRQLNRRLISNSFKHASMICARDSRSIENIVQVTGSLPNLQLRSDFTNLLPAARPMIESLGQDSICIIPNSNMISPRNAQTAWLQRYEKILALAIAYYREKGFDPFFLNHGGAEDASLISRMNKNLDLPLVIINESNPYIIKGIISASRGVMCSRYHGCVSALSQGIACLGTSWSHKYEELFNQYNAIQLLMQPNIPDDECKKIIDLSLEKDSKLQEKIRQQAVEHEISSLEMWSALKDVISPFQSFTGLADSKTT